MVHSSKTRNFRGIAATAGTVAAGLILLAVPQAASAAENTNAATATPQASQQTALAQTCTVNSNNVNFRTGPGTNYPSLGQVHQGQKLDMTGYELDWVKGNLWGGPTGVWIHEDYLDGLTC